MISTRIDDILQRKRTLSFEVFPPKKGADEKAELIKTIEKLKKLRPDFISVTYGAGGSNAREATEISGRIKAMGVEPLAHITGGPSSPEDIDRVSSELLRLGVENVLALRGDRPAEYQAEYCKHFPHATDLLNYLGNRFCLGAACYPEGHTECETLRDDIVNLKKKQECGAKFLITQIFYDNSYYYRLCHEASKMGVTIPIIPGIMPLINPKNISRIKSMCGSTISLDFRNMIESYASNPVVMREIGINYAVYQIIDLIAKGVPGIHLYIMNRADTAIEICGRLENVFNELF